MNFEEYHAKVGLHSRAPHLVGYETWPIWEGLGLAGEAGEVADKLTKGMRDGNYDVMGLVKELGDVLWYLDAAATRLGTTLEAVATANIWKLESREARGTIRGAGDDR